MPHSRRSSPSSSSSSPSSSVAAIASLALLLCAARPAAAQCLTAPPPQTLTPAAAAQINTAVAGVLTGLPSGLVATAGVLGSNVLWNYTIGGANQSSLFALGGLTKVLTAVLLLRAVDQGVVMLDQPLGEVWPAAAGLWPAAVTLRTLAGMCAGLVREPPCVPDACNVTSAQMLAELQAAGLTTLLTPPYARAAYSDLAYDLLGNALAAAFGGSSFEAVLQQEVLGPLNMTSTVITPTAAQLQLLAAGPGSYVAYGWRAPDGGALTSLADMVQLLKLLAQTFAADGGSGLVSASALHQLFTPVVFVANSTEAYGMPWLITSAYNPSWAYTKQGASPQYSSVMILLPQQQLGLVVLSTAVSGSAQASALGDLLSLQALSQITAILTQQYTLTSWAVPPAANLSHYQGTFQAAFSSAFNVITTCVVDACSTGLCATLYAAAGYDVPVALEYNAAQSNATMTSFTMHMQAISTLDCSQLTDLNVDLATLQIYNASGTAPVVLLPGVVPNVPFNFIIVPPSHKGLRLPTILFIVVAVALFLFLLSISAHHLYPRSPFSRWLDSSCSSLCRRPQHTKSRAYVPVTMQQPPSWDDADEDDQDDDNEEDAHSNVGSGAGLEAERDDLIDSAAVARLVALPPLPPPSLPPSDIGGSSARDDTRNQY